MTGDTLHVMHDVFYCCNFFCIGAQVKRFSVSCMHFLSSSSFFCFTKRLLLLCKKLSSNNTMHSLDAEQLREELIQGITAKALVVLVKTNIHLSA